MRNISFVLVFVLFNVFNDINLVLSTADIMRDIAKGFAKGLDECKKELDIQENIMTDLYHFWKEEYEQVNKNVGCIIICLSKKLDLLGENSKMHHGNAEEFAKKHGADEGMAKKIVELIHSCEKRHDSVEDECLRVLEVAKCFRTEINALSWTPNMQDVLEEVIAEV